MKRRRHSGTKVWRDPLLAPMGEGNSAPEAEQQKAAKRTPVAKRSRGRIVARPPNPRDSNELERERLLDRILMAEGRPSISRTVEDYLSADFELPKSQAVWLQILEHKDEERVTEAISQLANLLEDQEPKRRKVLESRLRRIEEFADAPATQNAAAQLRRTLNTRYAETLT